MGELEVRKISLGAVSMREVMRYSGVKEEYEGFLPLYEQALDITVDKIKSTVVFRVMDCRQDSQGAQIDKFYVASSSLAKHLSGCERVILVAATVGREIDILQAKYMRSSPSLAVLIGAIGSERIEAIMDSFAEQISTLGELTRRFSPGYGDLPIEFQKTVFSLLNPEKYIGLTLSDSLMMSPAKSVSAIIGVRKANLGAK